MSEARPDIEAAADTLFALLGTGRTIDAPRAERLDMPTAYAIAASIRERREARGERWVGRKIGFTPLYLTEAEVVSAAEILGEVIRDRLWDDAAYRVAGAVT